VKFQQSRTNTSGFTHILLVWEPDGVFAYGDRGDQPAWEYLFSNEEDAKAFCRDEWGVPVDTWA
jgi:hypothetical protein